MQFIPSDLLLTIIETIKIGKDQTKKPTYYKKAQKMLKKIIAQANQQKDLSTLFAVVILLLQEIGNDEKIKKILEEINSIDIVDGNEKYEDFLKGSENFIQATYNIIGPNQITKIGLDILLHNISDNLNDPKQLEKQKTYYLDGETISNHEYDNPYYLNIAVNGSSIVLNENEWINPYINEDDTQAPLDFRNTFFYVIANHNNKLIYNTKANLDNSLIKKIQENAKTLIMKYEYDILEKNENTNKIIEECIEISNQKNLTEENINYLNNINQPTIIPLDLYDKMLNEQKKIIPKTTVEQCIHISNEENLTEENINYLNNISQPTIIPLDLYNKYKTKVTTVNKYILNLNSHDEINNLDKSENKILIIDYIQSIHLKEKFDSVEEQIIAQKYMQILGLFKINSNIKSEDKPTINTESLNKILNCAQKNGIKNTERLFNRFVNNTEKPTNLLPNTNLLTINDHRATNDQKAKYIQKSNLKIDFTNEEKTAIKNESDNPIVEKLISNDLEQQEIDNAFLAKLEENIEDLKTRIDNNISKIEERNNQNTDQNFFTKFIYKPIINFFGYIFTRLKDIWNYIIGQNNDNQRLDPIGSNALRAREIPAENPRVTDNTLNNPSNTIK